MLLMVGAHHFPFFTSKRPNRFNRQNEGEEASDEHGHEGRIFRLSRLVIQQGRAQQNKSMFLLLIYYCL